VKTGIALNEHIDAMGELVFRHACAMGASYRNGSARLTGPARLGTGGQPGYDPGARGRWLTIAAASAALARRREGVILPIALRPIRPRVGADDPALMNGGHRDRWRGSDGA
jgi:hypothetical protein